MSPMLRPLCAITLLAAFAHDFASAAALRHRSVATVVVSSANESATVAEIHEKWDKMDDFLEIMFRLACKWKHGKDVNGLAAERLKNGELEIDEVDEFKRQTQAENVQMLKQACGRIVAGGKGKCRQGCADRWGKALGQRSECDGKCVTVYENFEADCLQKAGHLETVYEIKLKAASARERCYNSHCSEFPTVWMKEDEAAQKQEVDAQCENRCAADKVQATCQRKWQLEVDFIRAGVRSSCHADSKVSECFAGKKSTISRERETCGSSGAGTCDSQYTTCKTEGKTDATFQEAEAFCENRLKMCKAQVVEQCAEAHRQALEAAQAACEGADAEALDTCEADTLKKKEAEEVGKCVQERTPTCNADCQGTCKVDAMSKCLGNLADGNDAADDYCTDFWRLLHESTAVDPVTGDPIIALLAPAPPE